MALKFYESSDMTAIANAIRAKNGLTDKYLVSEMAAAIEAIPSGGDTGADLQTVLENTDPFEIENDASKVSDYSFKDKKISSGAFPNATSLGFWAFENCISLTSISAPNATEINQGCFHYCTKLTDASFPLCVVVYKQAFWACSKLKSVNLPSCTTLGESAFSGCSQLDTVSIPKISTIGKQCFEYCTALKKVELPATVSAINAQAFYGSGIETLIFRDSTSVPALGHSNAFNSTPIKNGSGYIYVPDNLVDAWKTATWWATYSAQIKPMSEYAG